MSLQIQIWSCFLATMGFISLCRSYYCDFLLHCLSMATLICRSPFPFPLQLLLQFLDDDDDHLFISRPFQVRNGNPDNENKVWQVYISQKKVKTSRKGVHIIPKKKQKKKAKPNESMNNAKHNQLKPKKAEGKEKGLME